MSVTYPQLDKAARAFLLLQVRRKGAISAVARELGYSRAAVSLALNGKYPGDTRCLRAKLFEVYRGRLVCPHLGHEIEDAVCAWWRTRPCPTAHAGEVSHWLACKACPLNPERRNPTSKEPVPCSA